MNMSAKAESTEKNKHWRVWGVKCCIKSCGMTKRLDYNTKFFRFPRQHLPLHNEWLKACKMKELPPIKKVYICERHFKTEQVITGKLDRKSTVPSLNLPTEYEEDYTEPLPTKKKEYEVQKKSTENKEDEMTNTLFENIEHKIKKEPTDDIEYIINVKEIKHDDNNEVSSVKTKLQNNSICKIIQKSVINQKSTDHQNYKSIQDTTLNQNLQSDQNCKKLLLNPNLRDDHNYNGIRKPALYEHLKKQNNDIIQKVDKKMASIKKQQSFEVIRKLLMKQGLQNIRISKIVKKPNPNDNSNKKYVLLNKKPTNHPNSINAATRSTMNQNSTNSCNSNVIIRKVINHHELINNQNCNAIKTVVLNQQLSQINNQITCNVTDKRSEMNQESTSNQTYSIIKYPVSYQNSKGENVIIKPLNNQQQQQQKTNQTYSTLIHNPVMHLNSETNQSNDNDITESIDQESSNDYLNCNKIKIEIDETNEPLDQNNANYEDSNDSINSQKTIVNEINNKTIKDYKEALAYLKPLEEFTLLNEDLRAVSLINHLELYFQEKLKIMDK